MFNSTILMMGNRECDPIENAFQLDKEFIEDNLHFDIKLSKPQELVGLKFINSVSVFKKILKGVMKKVI